MSTMFGASPAFPRRPFCVICGEYMTVNHTDYTCPFCPTEKPCPPRRSTGIPISRAWQQTPESVAAMRVGGAA